MSDHNGTLFRRGGTVRFVRWVSSRDGGWAPEIIQGRYLERDDAGSAPRTPEQALDTARVGFEFLEAFRF